MTNTDQENKHFIVCIERSIGSVGAEFERFYHIQAACAEEAQIKANKHLLANFDLNHFPDAFFADLNVIENLDAENNTIHAEIKNLIDQYQETEGVFPIKDGVVEYDGDTNNTAYPNPADEVTEQFFMEFRKVIDFIEVE